MRRRIESSRAGFTRAVEVRPSGLVIGRLHHVILDCPDPRTLARFYSELLGEPITYDSDDWVVVSTSSQASRFGVPARTRSPTADLAGPGDPAAAALRRDGRRRRQGGARGAGVGRSKLDGEDVFADPAGHPFCLIRRPGWAAPIPDDSH